MASYSYEKIRKILFVVGDETFSGVKRRNGTDELATVYNSSRIWTGNAFEKLGSNDIPESIGNDSIIPHLVAQFDEFGVYFVPVTVNEIKTRVCRESFKEISAYIKKEIKKICKVLKEYKSDVGISEYPYIVGIVYSGSINDASSLTSSSLNTLMYQGDIDTLVDDICFGKDGFSQINRTKEVIDENTGKEILYKIEFDDFTFFDVSVSIQSLSPVINEDGGYNYPFSFSRKKELDKIQRSITNKKYLLVENTSDSTTGEVVSDSEMTSPEAKESLKELLGLKTEDIRESVRGYLNNAGVIVNIPHVPGFLYSREEKGKLASNISTLISDHFLWNSAVAGIKTRPYRWVDSIDSVYLFNSNKIISDLSFFNEVSPIDKKGELTKVEGVGDFVLKLTKGTENLFYHDNINSEDIKFTHILAYADGIPIPGVPNPDQVFVSVAKLSRQTIQSNSKIKIKLRKRITNKGYSVPEPFDYIEYSYETHANHEPYLTYPINSVIEPESSSELGLVQSIKVQEIIDFSPLYAKDRSHRITNDIRRSGDSLYIAEGVIRDRDNSSYSPCISLYKSPDVESKYVKIGFDARLGLYYWFIKFVDDECHIHCVLTNGNNVKEIVYEVKSSSLPNIKQYYESPINKVTIAFDNANLIINYGGKVYKIQKEKSFAISNDKIKYTLDKSKSTVGEIYRNKGYIIFPAFYDLWHLAYVINGTDVRIIDCSGEVISIYDEDFSEKLPHLAYVENYPGPKNTDYKNITSTYILGALGIYEQLLNGIPQENIYVYDSAIVTEGAFKVDIYSLSYKNPHKISLKKKEYHTDKEWSYIKDFFIGNEGYGFKDVNNNWKYSYYNIDNESDIAYSSSSGRIVNARGVRIQFADDKLSLI